LAGTQRIAAKVTGAGLPHYLDGRGALQNQRRWRDIGKANDTPLGLTLEGKKELIGL
ncbi:MAG: hypothetical protein ACI9BW_003284, partial [Gammaproteobacteria bacterium]